MTGRRLPLLCALVAVLGVVGGVVTARTTDEGDAASPRPTVNDPLRLGIPLVSLGCTGEAVLVLGSGDNAAALTAAVSSAPDDVRYLRTDESCATAWSADPDEEPAYVAYTGPHDDESDPCVTRMEGLHARDAVTNLVAGNTELVNCVCVLPESEFPELQPPAPGSPPAAEPETVTWVTQLQQMLDDLDRPDDERPERMPSGVYDAPTAQRVAALQEDNLLPADGVVTQGTWAALKDAACGLYDY